MDSLLEDTERLSTLHLKSDSDIWKIHKRRYYIEMYIRTFNDDMMSGLAFK